MAKTKKIKFKFNAKGIEGHGDVNISGLETEEQVPKEVYALLERYGFSDDRFEEDESWTCFDSCSPGDCGVQDDIECITSIVEMQLTSTLKRVKGEPVVTFLCSLDDCRPGKGKSIEEAMIAGFNNWNKSGRPIEGITVKEALEEVLKKVNAKRK